MLGFFRSKAWIKLKRNKLAVFGLVLIILFALMAIFAPLLAVPKGNCLRDLNVSANQSVYNPFQSLFWKAIFTPPESCHQTNRISFSPIPTPPNSEAILGTSSGYDIWYGIVWGTRTAFQLAIIVVLVSVVIGSIVGAISGYFGGIVDNLLMRFVDVIFAFPSLILVIVIVALLGQGLWSMILAFTAVGWASYARIIRGEVLKIRSLEFVEGARALGATHLRIIFRHVLPNSLTALIAIAVLDVGSMVLSAASLSFLGLGTPVGYTDWGQMISFARNWIQGTPGDPFKYWYVSLFPGLTVILFGLAWNLFGDALRDALDPREK